MRNAGNWRPSKFVYRDGRLRASRDKNEVGIASRLVADRVGSVYQRALGVHARGRLLDLGCGKVPLYGTYRDHVTSATCVDWENTRHPSEYLDLEWDLTRPLPFEDGCYETVILSDVLEHLPEPGAMWKEIARLLVPGGKLLLNVPFFYWVHEQPHDYYRYTEFALRRLADSSGLKLIELEVLGGALEIVADVVAKTLAPLPRLGPPLALASQWLAAAAFRTPLGKRFSQRTSSEFPLGYFLVAQKPAPPNPPRAPPR